ncbi:MAG: T9SS type A sorting domain-containing protein [Chitinophagales bacterium]|nr:T9SS type A sorting domain-containing protein [Chitinophagales bacterium]
MNNTWVIKKNKALNNEDYAHEKCQRKLLGKTSNEFTNFKSYFMKAALNICLIVVVFLCNNDLFANGGWQQKLDLINSSDNANNSQIETMPNGDCLIATAFSQIWDTAIYLHQYYKENGEILLDKTQYISNKHVQRIHALKYLESIQKYILIYEEYKPYTVPFENNGIYYQIIESFEPFVISPKELLYAFRKDDLYTNRLVVNIENATIEAGFSIAKLIDEHIPDSIYFHRVSINLSNLDTISQHDSVVIPSLYNSTSIQHALYTMKKVQDDYILNLSNVDASNTCFAKLIKIHSDLSWDSAVVYFPNGFIAPQLLDNGNVLVKTDFFNDNYYTKTRVYNSDLEYLYSIDSTSNAGIASFYIEPNDGKLINLEADYYYPNQTGEYGMTKELIDITNRKAKLQEIWHINYPQEIQYRNFQIISQTTFKDGYAFLFGYVAGNSNRTLYLVKIDSLGNVYNNLIQGNVVGDMDNNCVFNEDTDVHMRDITVTANIDNYMLYTSTDAAGNYQFATNSSGFIKVAPRNNFRYPLWKGGSCSDTITVVLSTAQSVDSIDFNFQPTVICKNLTVDVALRRFRHFDPVYYDVRYCNTGTQQAKQAYIDISVDPLLEMDVVTSQDGNVFPFVDLGDNVYRLEVGDVSIFDCGTFIVQLHERPEAVLGQTVCIESHIYPDDVCTLARYEGSIIEASAECLGDSVRLQLRNKGQGMVTPKPYFVIEDQVIRKSHNYLLASDEILTEMLPADSGKTYRILAEQEDGFPQEIGDRYTTAAIEGCRPVPGNPFSTGNILPFPNYDGAPYFSTDCKVIVGSFDPNEKTASPIGYGSEHFIEKNTAIDYTIYFQNTGNDTAYKVVVIDTISPSLDINTISSIVTSHNFQFERIDSNVVRFVFDSIYLVDSFQNEPLSHGFIKFNIQQTKENPKDTKIYNSAAIYFDRNAPIVTNATFHTIGENYIEIKLVTSAINNQLNFKSVQVLPNPFREKASVVVEGDELQNPLLLLINVQGQVVRTIIPTIRNTFEIEKADLAKGMYLFKILENNNEVAVGKLLAQ